MPKLQSSFKASLPKLILFVSNEKNGSSLSIVVFYDVSFMVQYRLNIVKKSVVTLNLQSSINHPNI